MTYTGTTLTLDNGDLLFIEPERQTGMDRRAFKAVNGGFEWAHLSDVIENRSDARFYAFAPRELPEPMAAHYTV